MQTRLNRAGKLHARRQILASALAATAATLFATTALAASQTWTGAGGGVPIEAGEIANMPNTTVPIAGENAQKLMKLLDTLEDHDDVQAVSHNAELPESVSA